MAKPGRRTVSIDQKVLHAFERNGINTLLLDIRDEITKVGGRVGNLEQRDVEARDSRRILHEKVDGLYGLKEVVQRIVPLVDQHEARVQQHIGKQQLIASAERWLTKGKAAWIALFSAGGLLASWHFWR